MTERFTKLYRSIEGNKLFSMIFDPEQNFVGAISVILKRW